MKTEDTDIQFAKGLAQAHKRRQGMLDPAIDLFQEATIPEQRAAAARLLIGMTEQADVDFVEHMTKVMSRIQADRRSLAAVGAVLGGEQ